MKEKLKNYYLFMIGFIILLLLPIIVIKLDIKGLELYFSYYGILITAFLVIYQVKKNFEDNLKIEEIKEQDEVVLDVEWLGLDELVKYKGYVSNEKSEKYKNFKNIKEDKVKKPYILTKTKYGKKVYDLEISFNYEKNKSEKFSFLSLDGEKKILLPCEIIEINDKEDKKIFLKYGKISDIEIKYRTVLGNERNIKYMVITDNGVKGNVNKSFNHLYIKSKGYINEITIH